MPWCPKCKTEYIEGIDKCADCRTPLVASLKNGSSPEKPGGTQALQEEEPDHLYDSREASDETFSSEENPENIPLTGDELCRQLSRHTVTYVKPDEQYKDTRSSGYMLTLIGAAGIVVIALIAVGIIPLSLDPVMQYVFYAVLGILFAVFLIMGINALKRAGEYKTQIAKESALEERLLSWLLEDCQKERLDACQKGEATVEESYFACQELMKQMILEKEPDIKEDYMNYFIEKAYSQMYENS